MCFVPSDCSIELTGTVEFLLENGWRVEGGQPFTMRSVSYQGTTDDVPFGEALGVTLIVNETVTDQSDIMLVDADGNEGDPIEAGDELEPGRDISRSFVLGRASPDGPWRLAVIGAP